MPLVDLKCPYCGHLCQVLDPIEEEMVECSACDEFFTPEEAIPECNHSMLVEGCPSCEGGFGDEN